MACEPIKVQKSIIVSGFEQRGKITGSDIFNPGAEDGRFTGGNANENGGNWYESCLTNEASNGFNTNVNYKWTIEQVSGPSFGEPDKDLPLLWFWWVIAVSSSVPGYNLTVLPSITNGCVSGGGGPVTGVKIIDRGNYLTVDDQTIWNLQGSGKDGQIRLTIQPNANDYPSVSRTLRSIELTNAGSGYKVGDTTGISGVDFSPSVQEQAFVEVSSVQAQTSVYVNHYHVRQTDPDKNFGLKGGDGWAIGDKFAVVLYPPDGSPGSSPFNDNNAIYEVTAIDVTNTVQSDSTLQYEIERGVKLVYNVSSNDKIVDLVTEYDENSTSDPVLLESASEVFRIWLQFLGRKPTDLEFQYYVKQFYDNGGQTSPEISELISNQFAYELDNNVTQILSSCQQEDDDGNLGFDNPPSGTDCVWNRNDFFQGSAIANSGDRNIRLNSMWAFFGQPAGPSGPGGGASVEDLVCPKPDDMPDQEPDNLREPDLSDFAGMRLWRWIPCADGSNGGNSNLGGYEEIIVPCPGTSEGCVNPESEDGLAVYYSSSKLTWNNGETSVGNFVKTAKTGQAQEITSYYQFLLGRVPKQQGIQYWDDVTNQTVEDEYAIYWANGYVKWNDGSSNITPLVKQTKSTNALAINNAYLNILGRPAEQAGMALWANEADSIGIANTLNNIEKAAEAELGRGGINVVQYGIERTKQLIYDVANSPDGELSRGGVSSFKFYCETQVSSQIDMSFFLNCRLPPKYGTLTVQPPQIFGTTTFDTMYLNYVPDTQVENVGGFVNDNGQGTRKYGFDNQFNISWFEPQGELFGADPPIVVRYIEGKYLTDTGNVVDFAMPIFQDWTTLNAGSRESEIDSLMVSLVGQRNVIQFDSTGTDWAGSLGTSVGMGQTKTLEEFDPFVVYKPLYPEEGVTDQDEITIPLDDAKDIAYNENPTYGFKTYWRIKATTYCFDPETLEEIPGLTVSDTFVAAGDTESNRFLSVWSPIECPNGTQECPDGTTKCIEDECGGVGVGPGGGGCQSLSLSCGQSVNLYRETNEPTTITFSYRINNYSTCDVNGSARVSIRKFWPCPVFGPPSGQENQWVVQKRSVPINSSGDAIFELQVNTSKDDYLPTAYQDQTVDDPGFCHWYYVAYWEVTGMSGTSIGCNYGAWENPGCDYGTVHNFLDEILCVQQQNCLNDPGSNDCTGSEASKYFGPEDIDPTTCLPYCDTSNTPSFYWDNGLTPDPGVNCVIRGSGPGGGGECSSDCPTCEQTIGVFVGDTTECGPLKKPGLLEGTGPGNNNAIVEVGGTEIGKTTRNEVVIARDDAGIFTRQKDGIKAFPIKLEQWVTLAPVTVKNQTVEGKEAAVDFTGEDRSGTYERCCESFEATFECYDLPGGWCEDYENGEIENTLQVDCDAEVRVGATWWVTFIYKRDDGSTYTTSNQINFYSNWDTPDEEPRILIPTDYWPVDAGNGANGLPMNYAGLVGGSSYYTGSGFTYLPIFDNTIGYEIYLSISASNDHWWIGGERGSEYHPPPPGFNEGDFGTDSRVSSQRFPWAIGTGGIAGPKDERFLVAKFKITDDVSLPTADWTAVLEGCEDAQVYDRYDFWNEKGLTCGVEGQPGYYNCQISGLGQYQESWINYDGSTGGALVFGCNPWDNAPDPTCAPPLSSVNITLNTTDGSGIFDFEYDGSPTTGLRVIWYLNGRIVSRDFRQAVGSFDVSNSLSSGDKSFDFSDLVSDAEQLYTVEAVILMNSSGTGTGRPLCAFKDPRDVPEEDRWKSENYALQRGSSRKPINVVDDIQEGEYWQVVLGGASCTFQGNDGTGTGKKLTGLQAPQFTIQSYDNGAPDDNCLTASDTECCDPRYADNNPTNRCDELILGGIINCCGDDNGDFGTGKLRVNLENGTTAWPFIPGTQERVVGSTRYYWEQQDNANNWIPIPGGTGDAVSIVRDGRSYRVTVTYDVTTASNFPSGYTADPATTQTTKSITPSADGYETCPDGSTAPIGQCDDPSGPCNQPTYIANEYIKPLQANYEGTLYTKVTVPNNTSVPSFVSLSVSGFNNVNFVSGTARLKNGPNLNAPVNLAIAAGAGTGTLFLTASPGAVTGSNTTKTYEAQINIVYKCQDTQDIREVTFNVGSMEITWGSGGTDPGGEYPKLFAPPECFFGAGYTNNSGCGSYLAQWQDSVGGQLKYYYHTVKNDINPDNRGELYEPGKAQQFANCSFCPATTCPSVKVTSVTISPNPPQVNNTITLQLNYNWNPNGYTPTTNPFLNNGQFEQITWTLPDGQTTKSGAQVTVGPYTTEGVRNFTVTIAKFFEDPNSECVSGFISGIVTDTYEFSIDVGGTGPGPGPGGDPVLPKFTSVTIDGDSSLTLNNGSVVGDYSLTYVLDDGVGYQPSTREVTVKWDDENPRWYDRDDGKNYSRTFTQAGPYTVAKSNPLTGKAAKLYAKPGYEGPLDSQSIIDAGMGKWVSETDYFDVNVYDEDSSPNILPTSSISMTQSTARIQLVDGEALVRFSATATVNDGTYTPTPEPTALRYNIINDSTDTSALAQNVLSKNWSHIFTQAGTYTVGARYRKNYCAEGLTECTGTTAGKIWTNDSTEVTVVVEPEDTGPVGNKPSAELLATTYEDLNGNSISPYLGCAISGGRVLIYFTIQTTAGTGDYVFNDIDVIGSPLTWTSIGGGRWQASISRSQSSSNTVGGNNVAFLNSQGVEVHRERINTQDWCVTIVDFDGEDTNPPGPDINPDIDLQ